MFDQIARVAITALLGPWLAGQFSDFIDWLTGKQVTVLGARGVGKTHLVSFLSTGSIKEGHKQTLGPETFSGRRLQLKDLKLRLSKIVDHSGAKDAYAQWQKQAKEADVVLYLVRADLLRAGDKVFEERVAQDMTHIAGWLEERKQRPLFFIVGTHCDLDPAFKEHSANKGDYLDSFRKIPTVQTALLRSGKETRLVLGSMKTLATTEELVSDIFRTVANNG